jgi:hypothetical protein
MCNIPAFAASRRSRGGRVGNVNDPTVKTAPQGE